MRNVFVEFLALVPRDAKMVGVVVAVIGDQPVVELPGGGKIKARGQAAIGDRVYVRGGAIEGPAPTLPFYTTEV